MPTPIFGRVFEVRKYKLKRHVKTKLRAASRETGANIELTGAARLYRARSSDRRERG